MILDYKKSQLEEILDQVPLFTDEEAKGMRSGVISSRSPLWVGHRQERRSEPWCDLIMSPPFLLMSCLGEENH